MIDRLLSLHDSASPFTLILDTLEQTSQRLIEEVILRAKVSLSFLSRNDTLSFYFGLTYYGIREKGCWGECNMTCI